MSLPSQIASDVFADGELTNEVKWYTRIFTVINSIITYLTTYLSDGGWQPLTVNSGYAALSGNPPYYRVIGNRVYLKGAISNTGITASGTFNDVITLPVGARPTVPCFYAAPSSTAAALAEFPVSNSGPGQIDLRAAATVGAYYFLTSISFFTD